MTKNVFDQSNGKSGRFINLHDNIDTMLLLSNYITLKLKDEFLCFGDFLHSWFP